MVSKNNEKYFKILDAEKIEIEIDIGLNEMIFNSVNNKTNNNELYMRMLKYLLCDKNELIENNKYINKKEKNSQLLYMVGGPGSGKSSGKKKILELNNLDYNTFINIDPDDLLEFFFNNSEYNRKFIFSFNEKIIKYFSFEKYNIIWDTSGRSYNWAKDTILKTLKNLNYNIIICIMYNKIENVKSRIKIRAEKIGRNIPNHYLNNTYTTLKNVIPKYLNLDCKYADHIYIYDNSGSQLNLVYHSSCNGGNKKIF